MKTNILNLTAIALIVTVSVFTGCKKDDATAPTVTLAGASSETVSLQGSYTEQGATAEDDKDGKLTPTVSGTVDVNMTGTYVITYTATDAAGNSGTATRTVYVVNDAADLAGTYTVTETCAPSAAITFPQTVTASSTVNNRIEFNKFANYAGNTAIYAMVTGSTISIVSQPALGIGTDNGNACDIADHTFVSQSGATTVSGFTITFTDQLTGPGACTGSAASCVEVFVK